MKKVAIALLVLLCLAAGVWWFLADEELEPATQAWIDAPRADQDAEGLDFLFFMGMMAPPGADPIEHARDLIRQHEENFDLRVDYLPDLMADSPCEIEDWACWDSNETPWVADTLNDNAHVLERWYSLPVHHDFGEEPIMRWLLGIFGPSHQLLDHLMTLQLIDARRSQSLDELAVKALEQSFQLSAARPMEGNRFSLSIFEMLKSQSLRQVMLAVRLGAKVPDQERLDRFKGHQLPVGDQLVAWAHLQFDRFHYTWPGVYRDSRDQLVDKENRTLNHARACLEQVIELADAARLFDFMEAEAEICGPGSRRWRNWHGDWLVDAFFFDRNEIACRFREFAHRDDLAIALLDALAADEAEDTRLAEVARANPFYPRRGAFLKDDQVCFEPLTPRCGEACLPAPWSQSTNEPTS